MLKNVQEWVLLLGIFGVVALIGNWVGYEILPTAAVPGMLILIGICLAGLILGDVLPGSLPSIAYVALVGVLLSMPWMPGSDYIVSATSEVELLALTTPILAYAGIAIGRSWTDFVKLGWRSIVVAVCVMLGTFLGSALIAEAILKFQGII
ncbi:lysine exporter LysO family protein [Halobacillus sp. Nhm2S1]|uniref:lysine exporter LysO family protein n=1 Tax=Halobacillus sp. Nhm2S1 TaxID=2866716 RepID=UPI001C72BB0D|nr:lysine exporter LysO family protein [Halobacillus sp. Nhm2S1]MBX0357795.1 lysine exporter LysO family protein [Halobacillus sp. Nhm2S1]